MSSIDEEKAEKGWLRFKILSDTSLDLSEQIFDLAVERKWKIRQLSLRDGSLEDAFVDLVKKDLAEGGGNFEMRTWLIIFLKELRYFFLSPLAFIVMALFTFLNGWLFATMVKAMSLKTMPYSLVYNLFTSSWFWMGAFILFPLITMRLFAEEKKMGTFEGLMTAPVRTSEVLLAKYFAALTVYLAIVGTVVPVFSDFQNESPSRTELSAMEPCGAAPWLLYW